MQFIKSDDYKKGSNDLANEIISQLNQGKKVLWFLTGGSSIPSCVEALNILKNSNVDLKKITVTLTDERYGEVGHKDSSWQKLIDAGFDFESVNSIPILTGKDFDETTIDFEDDLSLALRKNNIVISQFGIGSDLHIAGILPESPATDEICLVSAYVSEQFKRITLSFNAIRYIDKAFVFMFGENKKQALIGLQQGGVDLKREPAQILYELKEVMVFSDQVKDKQITTFIFDCFNVFFTPPLFEWYKRNIGSTDNSDPNFQVLVKNFDLGVVPESEFLDYLLSHDSIKLTKDELINEIDSLCLPDEKLIKLAQEIKSKGYKIALLSNGGHELFERRIYVDFPEFKDLFDKIVISSEVHMVKPDPEIYLYTLDFIDSKPEESIFIDDNERYVDVANNLGIKGYVYSDVDTLSLYLKDQGLI